MLLSAVHDFIADHLMQYKSLLGSESQIQLFAIEQDKIDGKSIKYSSSNLVQWT